MDGVLTEGEWDGAFAVDFQVFLPQATDSAIRDAQILIKSDSANICFALNLNAGTDDYDGLTWGINFDQELLIDDNWLYRLYVNLNHMHAGLLEVIQGVGDLAAHQVPTQTIIEIAQTLSDPDLLLEDRHIVLLRMSVGLHRPNEPCTPGANCSIKWLGYEEPIQYTIGSTG